MLLLLGTGFAGTGQSQKAAHGQSNDLTGPRSDERGARLQAEREVDQLKIQLRQNTTTLEQVRAAASRTERELRAERSRRLSAEKKIGELKSVRLKLREMREQIQRTAALSAGSDLSQNSISRDRPAVADPVAALIRPPQKVSSMPSDRWQTKRFRDGANGEPYPSLSNTKRSQPPSRLTWRRIARQWSNMTKPRSLTAKLRPTRTHYHAIGVKIRHRDVNIRRVHVLYGNGSRQVLPLKGVIRDESGMRTFRLRRGRGGPRRVTIQHQSTFNTKGPGSVEIWVRRSDLPRQKAAAR